MEGRVNEWTVQRLSTCEKQTQCIGWPGKTQHTRIQRINILGNCSLLTGQPPPPYLDCPG